MEASETAPPIRRRRPTRREYWRGVLRFAVLVGITATVHGVLRAGWAQWPALFTLATFEKAVINVVAGIAGGVFYVSLMYGLPDPRKSRQRSRARAG